MLTKVNCFQISNRWNTNAEDRIMDQNQMYDIAEKIIFNHDLGVAFRVQKLTECQFSLQILD